MRLKLRAFYWVLPFLLLLGACHRTPDHAKYIPKNALMVAEVNTKELSKKIAWSMITGSNLWDKLRGSKSKSDSAKQSEFIKNMQEAGVDELNTFYAYLKNNGSNDKEACFVALVPLKDAMKWEGFVKKTFTEATIKENKKRKEARLSDEIYAGWTNNLLIVVSVQKAEAYNYFEEEPNAEAVVDKEVLMSSYLESAFNVTKENSLLSDQRFAEFEKHKHDLGFWVNIDAVMSSYGSKNLDAMTGGLSLANTMWRNSAFSAATNFEKGRIVTEMLMYSSDELKEINKKYAPQNIDEDLVNRIPGKGLDFMMAYRMSPEATQKTIEKMGMLGLANGYLKAQNLSVQEIMEAISGDMVFSMNNYAQQKETLLFDSSDASSAFSNYKTDMDVLFAIKLNKKEAFRKILNIAVELQMLEQIKDGVFRMKSISSGPDSSVIMVNDRFAVFANKPQLAYVYLNSPLPKQPPLLVKEHIYKQPFALFFDYSSWAKRTGAVMANNAADTLVYNASLKTFENFVFNGGSLKDNVYKYSMSINFVNKKESSLIQLFDFGKVLQEAQEMRDKEAEKYEMTQQQNADSLMF
ncbi:MAG: DUF4836 family protein [Bacteroidota bacterium]